MRKLPIFFLLLAPAAAFAQSSSGLPSPSLSPPYTVWTPSQWTAFFAHEASKVDGTNGVANNLTLNGATVGGQMQDVRIWFGSTGASCSTDVSAAVNAAVTAGVKRLWLPANCTYVTTTTPADVTIDGEDWETSIISVANRATTSLSMGARSVLHHVGIISENCDVNTQPTNTQKYCPVGTAINNQDVAQQLNNWPRQGVTYWSGSVTYGGVTSTDVPGISSVIQSTGSGSDAFFAGSNGTGSSGLRVVITGTTANGLYAINGQNATSTIGRNGVLVQEYTGNNIGSYPLNASYRIDRAGDGTTDVQQSFRIDDADSVQNTNTSDNIVITDAHQSSGNFINLFQTGTTDSGNGINMNFGNGGGSFTGNFLAVAVAGVNKMVIKNNGGIASQVGNQFATVTVGQTSSSLTIGQGEFGFIRQSGVFNAPGAAGAKLLVVCGTNSGTAAIEMVAGTSTTPVKLVDNVGAGVSGC